MLTLEIRGADIFENTHECRFYRPYVLRGIKCFRMILKTFRKIQSIIPENPLFTSYVGGERCRGISQDAVVPVGFAKPFFYFLVLWPNIFGEIIAKRSQILSAPARRILTNHLVEKNFKKFMNNLRNTSRKQDSTIVNINANT